VGTRSFEAQKIQVAENSTFFVEMPNFVTELKCVLNFASERFDVI